MNLHDILLRPSAAPVLLLLPVLWYLLRRLDRARAARLVAVIGPRHDSLAGDLSLRRRSWRRRLALAALGFLMLAALEPTWGGSRALLESPGRDLVFVLDVSRSMLAQDLKPGRLERAKEEIRTVLRGLRGDRVGLVVFAGEARLLSPLTRDLDSFLEILAAAAPESVGRGGTDIAAAIELGARALGAAESDARTIVLLTDGEDQEGRGEAAAKRAHESGLVVQTFGLGTALGAKIPVTDLDGTTVGYLRDGDGAEVISRFLPESLIALARVGGGDYAAASTEGSLAALVAAPTKAGQARAKAGDERRLPSRYQWPLFLAFVLLLIELAMTDRRRS